jgi:hypothetical protein
LEVGDGTPRTREQEFARLAVEVRGLPREPAGNGVTIRAQLPGGKSVMRKFPGEVLGRAVYVWAASEATGLLPEEITISVPTGEWISQEMGIAEQGLVGRVAVVVMAVPN